MFRKYREVDTWRSTSSSFRQEGGNPYQSDPRTKISDGSAANRPFARLEDFRIPQISGSRALGSSREERGSTKSTTFTAANRAGATRMPSLVGSQRRRQTAWEPEVYSGNQGGGQVDYAATHRSMGHCRHQTLVGATELRDEACYAGRPRSRRVSPHFSAGGSRSELGNEGGANYRRRIRWKEDDSIERHPGGRRRVMYSPYHRDETARGKVREMVDVQPLHVEMGETPSCGHQSRREPSAERHHAGRKACRSSVSGHFRERET